MDVKIEFVDCPFCDGKMVPLSGWIYEGRIKKALESASRFFRTCQKRGHCER